MKKLTYKGEEARCGDDVKVTIRVTKQMRLLVERAAQYMGPQATPKMVWSEAVSLGLQYMHGWSPERGFYLHPDLRPLHPAEIHEAGHVVAVLFAAEGQDLLPAACQMQVKLEPDGSGTVSYRIDQFTPTQYLRILVAGAVADAKYESVPFSEIWDRPDCRMDRKQAQRLLNRGLEIGPAVEYVRRKFEDPCTWYALVSLSRKLKVNAAVDGIFCSEVFSKHLRIARKYRSRTRAMRQRGRVSTTKSGSPISAYAIWLPRKSD